MPTQLRPIELPLPPLPEGMKEHSVLLKINVGHLTEPLAREIWEHAGHFGRAYGLEQSSGCAEDGSMDVDIKLIMRSTSSTEALRSCAQLSRVLEETVHVELVSMWLTPATGQEGPVVPPRMVE